MERWKDRWRNREEGRREEERKRREGDRKGVCLVNDVKTNLVSQLPCGLTLQIQTNI